MVFGKLRLKLPVFLTSSPRHELKYKIESFQHESKRDLQENQHATKTMQNKLAEEGSVQRTWSEF